MEDKISVVMAYFNRYQLLDYTLETMSKSAHKNVEVIVVDDFGTEEEDVEDFITKYPGLNVKIVYMADQGEKWYVNPCVVYNAGFSAATGNKILIQNPECCHVGDVLSTVAQRLTDDNYLSFHCYASTEPQLAYMKTDWARFKSEVDRCTVGNCGGGPQGGGWCNHNRYFPNNLNFTTAITRKSLAKLNGFDEIMAHGRGGDDNEFRDRVQMSGLKVEFISDPWTIHQWHPKVLTSPEANKTVPWNQDLLRRVQRERAQTKQFRAHNDGKQIIKDL